ncbi:MAG: hypothetical protein HOQ05_04635 [Corynebacteriales bacterium]|nr:hypothetical protein [Mycobacteriales bacterium]
MTYFPGDRVKAARRLGGVWAGWVDAGTAGLVLEDRAIIGVRYYVEFENGVIVDWLTSEDIVPAL